MSQTLIGTSGYSFDDWRGVFYPEQLDKMEFLEYYALFFAYAELGFTFHEMPTKSALSRLAARTPGSFRFSIVAHRSLTHDPSADWRKDAATFADAATALAETGRLVAIVLKLPRRFRYDDGNRMHLGALCDTLRDFPLFAEFGNDEWHGASVVSGLDERGVGTVVGGEAPPSEAYPITGGKVYARLRGRTREAWWEEDGEAQPYSHSDEELAAWASWLRRSGKRAQTAIVTFGNHRGGNAVIDAERLRRLLG